MADVTDASIEKVIPISQLLVDVQNPRLPDIQTSQREAIRTMVAGLGDKIIALANHMQENGPNPASLLIVIPSGDETGKYIVLDGNRRLTALKLLEMPALADGILDGKSVQKLKHMAAGYSRKPLSELRCIVYLTRDEADKWIELIHRGEKSGAGLVEWDGQVAARYDARKGNKSTALHVLDFVKENAELSEETKQKIDAGKFPITNLERLVNTPYVRKKLGIDITGDDVVASYPNSEVLKGLTRVVEDLGSGQVTVSQLKSQSQRIDYINGLNQNELPKPEKALEKPLPLGTPENDGGGKTEPQATKPSSPRAPVMNRNTLIPKGCKLGIKHPRLQKIYDELKRLDLNEFPNCGAVMLRVFVELSLDYYLEHQMGKSEQTINGMKLSEKLNSVINYFEQNGVMTSQQLTPIKAAAGGQSLLASSVKTLHGYVHNPHFSPVASELKTAWDNLQPFIEKLWPI